MVAVLVALGTGVVTPIAPAEAAAPLSVRGTVADAFGDPVAGAQVWHDGRTVTTDAGGRYSLPRSHSNTWILAWADGLTRVERRLGTSDVAADFVLRYTATAVVGPTLGANGVERQARVFASPPESRCVDLVDDFTGQFVTLRRKSRDFEDTFYRGSLVPADRPDGVYGMRAVVTDCETHSADAGGTAVTIGVDTTGPDIAIDAPRWTNATRPGIRFTTVDAVAGVDPSNVRAYIDGNAVGVSFDGTTGTVAVPHLEPGYHSVIVVAYDRVGNQASAGHSLKVDLEPPTLTAGRPGGTTTMTPRVEAVIRERGSGLDPTSALLRISGPSGSRDLPFIYDDAARTLWYQVPLQASGSELGDGPLPAGDYTGTVRISDRAGNWLEQSWTFTVIPPAR